MYDFHRFAQKFTQLHYSVGSTMRKAFAHDKQIFQYKELYLDLGINPLNCRVTMSLMHMNGKHPSFSACFTKCKAFCFYNKILCCIINK